MCKNVRPCPITETEGLLALMRIFMVRSVPFTSWSSSEPLNFHPKLKTLGFLCFGLFIFGLGEILLIAAGLGVTPWTVLAQGLGEHFEASIGTATFIVSVGVLLLWIPLRQIPGLGTILNVIIIAATIEFVLPILPPIENLEARFLLVTMGIVLVGIGSGIYLVANLGAGPRDGVMTGLQSVTQLPIAWIRIGIELSVVLSGWLLGGVVGLGTIMFALGIGPAVSAGLFLMERYASATLTTQEPNE